MPTVDQHLRAVAQSQPGTPFWVLEKDYALGYLLSGMAQTPALHDTLVLKGGTALRKFYFADYRFSEDLDFSAVARSANADTAMQDAVSATETQLQLNSCTFSKWCSQISKTGDFRQFGAILSVVLPSFCLAYGPNVESAGVKLQERGPFAVTLERLTLRDPHPGGQDAFTVRVRFPTHR